METANFGNVVVFFSVLVGFGAIGGLGSAMLDEEFATKDKTTNVYGGFSGFILARSLVLGVLAAVTVPLFLSIASLGQGGVVEQAYDFLFGLGKDATNDTNGAEGKNGANISHLLILCGFCVIAAMSARRFVERLTDAMLKAVKEEVDQQNKPLKQKVDRAVSQVEKNYGPTQKLSKDATELLDVFIVQNSKSVSKSIAESFAIEHELDFEEAFDELMDKGFVRERDQEIRLRSWGGTRILSKVDVESDWLAVLQALISLPIRPRPTSADLAKTTELEENKVEEIVKALLAWGLVAESESEPGGYRIRSWGRTIVSDKTGDN